ncbi:MAG TPA: T9SS type A sorting domain-containing protein, partial [Bacteroidia bacterium]|nr:T9SS type A sorting domain-containing protein [Bacteroidia bacterium]
GGWHHYDGGTSTACPVGAGIAALYLQMHPTANSSQVYNAMIYCADQDKYTGTTPNNQYGYGKVNAFKTLTGCATVVVPEIQMPTSSLYAYPNPMIDESTINYDFSSINEFCTASIVFYDIMGRQVKNIELKNSKGSVSVTNTGMAAGTYFYSLTVDDRRINTEKLSVTK